MQYVAAIVKIRVVLLQIVPVFTLWSIIAVDLASCPVLVFSKAMVDRMPPLLLTDPFALARKLLLEGAAEEGSKSVEPWKVLSLGHYIFVVISRAVKFFFTLVVNTLLAPLLVFDRDQKIFYLLLVIIIIEFFEIGLAYSLYLTLLLHRYLFPVQNESTDAEADANDVSHENDNADKHNEKHDEIVHRFSNVHDSDDEENKVKYKKLEEVA